MVTPLQLSSWCKDIINLVEDEKYTQILFSSEKKTSNIKSLDKTLFKFQYQRDDLRNHFDMITIYSLLHCRTGIREEIQNIRKIIDPIIIKSLLLTARFPDKRNIICTDIGSLDYLPELALINIQKCLYDIL
jgi:hypothetical protein